MYQAIKNDQIDQVYIFQGDERYMLDNTLQMMMDKSIDQGQKDFNLHIFSGQDASVNQILEACEMLPFFDKRRIVVVRDIPIAKQFSKEELDRLKEYASAPAMSTVLVIAPLGNYKTTAFYKALQKKGMVVNFETLAPLEYNKWVKKKFKQVGVAISSSDIHYFCQKTTYGVKGENYTLYDADNHIQAISHSANNGTVTRELIDAFIKDPIENSIFKLMDAIIDNNMIKSMQFFNKLMEDKGNEIMVFGYVAKQFRNMYKCKKLLNEGYSSAEIAKRLDLKPYPTKKLCQYCFNYKLSDIYDVIKYLETVDYRMKRTNVSNSVAFEMLLGHIYTLKGA